MYSDSLKQFSKCGGCTAKLGADMLSGILHKIPKVVNDRLMVGYDSSDDAAVYKLTDDIAIVQTLDFFPPVADDPFVFGKIAATNALSDVYAMGGDVLTAMNIVCFPERMDTDILAEILRGGALKVEEAGGVLCGGHSVADNLPKYGLSVTGLVHPDKLLANNGCKIGDKIILTKPLGVGIITAANRAGEASRESYEAAVAQMETLNKYAAHKMRGYNVHGATDVTGFGFLGHLNEMCREDFSILVDASSVPYIPEAYGYASELLVTGAGQKNRNFLKDKVELINLTPPMEEILFDPQTSGGLLISVAASDADSLLKELLRLPIKSAIVGQVVKRQNKNIIVRGE